MGVFLGACVRAKNEFRGCSLMVGRAFFSGLRCFGCFLLRRFLPNAMHRSRSNSCDMNVLLHSKGSRKFVFESRSRDIGDLPFNMFPLVCA